MIELVKAIQLLGPAHMLKLRRGYTVGWEELMRGHFATRAIQALLNVGFVDELLAKQTVDINVFAPAAGLDRDILEALCESLYAIRILRKQGSCYELDDKGKLLIDVLRGWLEVNYGYLDIFDSLEDLLTRRKVYGRDVHRRPDFVAKGSGAMESWLLFPIANQMILQGGYRKVLDLGCGDGTFLRKLCRLNRDVECFGIDLSPEAIEDGKMRARGEGVDHRIALHAADIQDVAEMPEAFKAVQVATVFFALHEILYLGKQNVIDFLTGYRRHFPGVPLIVFEAIRPPVDEMRAHPGIAIYYYLYHDLSQQKPVGRAEWRELFQAAGYPNVEERYLRFARTSIFTLKP